MVDDLQFYPTPSNLREKMHDKLGRLSYGSVEILEPSCGSGELLRRSTESWVNGTNRTHYQADVCEIDSGRLEELSRIDNLNIVGHDFLEFHPSKKYTHILMNPPFRNGVKHLLHAWDIAYNTEIVCILNASNVKNPSTREQRYLVDLIEKHGSVEYLQEEFAEAQRKTSVEVALIYLKKETPITTDYLEGLDLDKFNPKFEGFTETNQLAIPNNIIENSVRLYNAARSALERMVESNAVLGAKYASISGILGGSLTETDEEGNRRVKTISDAKSNASPEAISAEYNRQLAPLKRSAWNYVLTGLNFKDKLTAKAQKEFESQFNTVSKLEFTEANIHGFLQGLSLNQGRMIDDVMLELFDRFTGSHMDNRQHYKAWKSNEKHKSNAWRLKTTRVVIPMRIFSEYSYEVSWDGAATLADIDKAMAVLDGKRFEDINGLHAVIKNTQQIGKRIKTDYFDVRLYMNGNVHLYPTRKDLIDRLNRTVGKLRQWLPDEDDQATNEFWKNYESEKTQKDIEKAKLRKSSYCYFNNDDLEEAIEKSLQGQNIDSAKFVNVLESTN